MKLAIQFGVSTYTSSNEDWASAVAYALEAERLGVDSAWTAETWGYDGATPLAYLAAKTSKIRLGTGILQVGARTPAMTAMTAMALASLSGNRFLLGLGVSGPQVIEGWHGVHFARPLQRLRETVEIVRRVTRGERLVYEGEVYQVPLPGGEGKALIPNVPPRPNLPVYLATLGPKSLELTGELAEGWLGKALGYPRGAHIIGWIMNESPEGVPAQRVINSKGELSGNWEFGSPDLMRQLLENEGTVFSDDGHVDLKRYGWDPTRDFS